MKIRAVLVALAVLLPSCQSVLDIEQLPRGAAVTELVECGPCVRESCLAAQKACLGDRACTDVYGCVAACGRDDLACRGGCERKFSTAARAAPFAALDGCRRENCTDECYGIGGFGASVDSSCACTDEICAPFLRNCIRSSAHGQGERVGDCERIFDCLGARRPVDPDDAVTCMFDDRFGGQVEANVVRFCWQGAICGTCPLAGGQSSSCLSKYKWAAPPSDEPVAFDLTVTDQRGKGVPDAKVAACLTTDCDGCRSPVDSGETDANGTVSLSLSTFGLGFRGCFQIEAPGKMPTMWYLGRPVTRAETLMRVPIFSTEELAGNVSSLGLSFDPTRGQVVLATRDCLFSPARGLTLDPPTAPGTVVAYLINGNPSLTGPTDDTGRAAVVNVPVGWLELVLRSGELEFSRSTVRVRAGFMTGVYALPNGTSLAP